MLKAMLILMLSISHYLCFENKLNCIWHKRYNINNVEEFKAKSIDIKLYCKSIMLVTM